MKRMGFASVAAAIALLTSAAAAAAAGGTQVCIAAKEGKPIVTPVKGVCKTGYTLRELGAEGKEGPEGKNAFSSEEITLLKSLLPHIHFIAAGVGGKPTIQFSGVNVQVINGEGKTSALNGEGNLVIGYDENASRTQTGSHDLVLGEEESFSSFGGLVAGFGNTISGREASVSGGALNTASGFYTAISGGMNNAASVEAAAVSGGQHNTASSQDASVQGGFKNSAEGHYSSIFGGKELTAKTEYEALP